MRNFDKEKPEFYFLKIDEKNLTKNARANSPSKERVQSFARVLTRLSAHATLQPVRATWSKSRGIVKMHKPPRRVEIF
jgi:hypothetical protein